MLKMLDELKIGTLKLLDKMLHFIRKDSPNFKAKASKNGKVSQPIAFGKRDAYSAGRDLHIGVVNKTWADKKDACEKFRRAIDGFFFAVFGKDGLCGIMTPKNLDSNGKIKEHCLFTSNRAFKHAQNKLESDLKGVARIFEEDNQKKLYKIIESLKKKDVYSITLKLKEDTLAELNSITKEELQED